MSKQKNEKHEKQKHKKYIIANHKNNPPNPSLITALKDLKHLKSQTIICPTLLSLHEFTDFSEFKLGVQRISLLKQTCTGEVSNEQLKNLKVKYVIVGHNERRAFLKESDEDLAAQLEICKQKGFVPVFCVGQQVGENLEVLKEQLKVYRKYCEEFEERIVAFEPVFAIGTGKTPSVEEIKETVEFLKSFFDEFVAVLYGGSVGLKNCKEISEVCDGLLIGGASLSGEFVEILKEIEGVTETETCDE